MSVTLVERYGPLVGRILIGGLYITSGLGLLGAFGPVTGLMAAKGVPLPTALLAITIAAWLVGGVCIVIGYLLRSASLILAAITVPVTYYIHAPWGADPAAFQNELNHFLKNLALIGGLLYVVASRPVALSLEFTLDEARVPLASVKPSR